MIVDLFIPCFIDQFYPKTGLNVVKILKKAGCGVNYNPEQTCCGQPAFNAGYWSDCKEVGQKFLMEFNNDRPIVCPSASCTGMIKNYYPEMFHNSSLHLEYKQVQKNIFEFSYFLVHVAKKTDFGAVFDQKAVFMDSCSALRECKIREEPRALLEQVRGLKLIEPKDQDTCCGFGGMFSVKFSELSVTLAEEKLDHALNTGAELIISTDMSCLMHLDAVIKKKNLPLKVMHLADVLAEGMR